ncbi:MAG: hypothetical protein GF401_08150 [Chitinivibrionales bacterium]|nr:hypothetical protein [Chitinivibrionales bacterium]
MTDIPINIQENIKEYEDCLAIKAPEKGRLWPILISGAIFALTFYSLTITIYRSINNIIEFNIASIAVMGIIAAAFGFVFIKFLYDLKTTTEVLLFPDQQKIVLRRERTKRVISEHSIDDIEIKVENVHHEDPSRTPMRWFTLFDTNRQKQIFAVRTAGQGGETIDTATLIDFFNEVMGKKDNV